MTVKEGWEKEFDVRFHKCHWCSSYSNCEEENPSECKYNLDAFKPFISSAISAEVDKVKGEAVHLFTWVEAGLQGNEQDEKHTKWLFDEAIAEIKAIKGEGK